MSPRRLPLRLYRYLTTLAMVTGLTACASGPPAPDWQGNVKSALDQATAAYLAGDGAGDARAFERAREALGSTGRPELMARAELMRCAARVASLVFEPCAGFERLRSDAAQAERAYAEHLLARTLPRDAIERLPVAQRGAATAIATGKAADAGLQGIADPLSRLIAAAVLFQAGLASPATIALAADTASAQGWRRPLLAWLDVQAQLAERGGAVEEAQRLRRRIALVQGGR